jgi:chitinase
LDLQYYCFRYLSDPDADLHRKFSTDSRNETENNLYGCTKQLYLLKKRKRHLKTLLSIGGFTYKSNFAGALATASSRKVFADSSVTLLSDLGFDGLDLDWESPEDDTQAKSLVSILKELRCALDRYASYNRLDYKFALTAAVVAKPEQFNIRQFAEMDTYLDYWSLSMMALFSPLALQCSGTGLLITNIVPSHSGIRLRW